MASLLAIIVATLNQSISDSLDVPSDWNLLLVNPWNPLPEGYEITLTQLQNGLSVDERCYPDLQDMMDDCRAADLQPVISSDYRSQETQQIDCPGLF